MADSAEVMRGLQPREGVAYPVLVPSLQGFAAAQAAGAREIAVFGAASEAFSQKNINCSIAESLDRFRPVVASAQVRVIERGRRSAVPGRRRRRRGRWPHRAHAGQGHRAGRRRRHARRQGRATPDPRSHEDGAHHLRAGRWRDQVLPLRRRRAGDRRCGTGRFQGVTIQYVRDRFGVWVDMESKDACESCL